MLFIASNIRLSAVKQRIADEKMRMQNADDKMRKTKCGYDKTRIKKKHPEGLNSLPETAEMAFN